MLYDPHRRWADDPKRACKGADLETFFMGDGSPGLRTPPPDHVQKHWDQVKEDFCKKCPVMHQCRRDTWGEQYGIWGGIDPYQRRLVRKALLRRAKNWPAARRAAWARDIYWLRVRDEPMDWTRISTRTGIPRSLAQQLFAEEEKRQKEAREERAAQEAQRRQEAAQEAARALEGVSKAKLPDKPGIKDLWVIHAGVPLDATYVKHSEDGEHVLVEIDPGTAHTRTWIKKADCRFYRQVTRQAGVKKGRKLYGPKYAAAA